MGVLERLNVGIVGAVGRGGSFRTGFEANGAHIHAVCDVQADRLDECAHQLGADEKYVDCAEMLEESDLDAVVIGTPMHLHMPQSIMALEKDLHVLSEVPAGVSIEECRSLMTACQRSKGTYMMAENFIYIKTNVLVKELVRQGLFGEVYYAEGEYLHELKELNEKTPWRRKWQTGIDGITYGTHSLGPILQWMQGDRVARVCCQGSGRNYRDTRGDPYHQDTSVMLCKTAKGALVKIRVDMVSDRPHAMTNYQLQGTDGVYESSRGGPTDRAKIWLRALSREVAWFDVESLVRLDDFSNKHLPEMWRNPPAEALHAGHGGGDYFEVQDFVRAVKGEAPCPVGIHEAMDMTLPGLVSQQSIAQGGAWLDVPDSRTWVSGQSEGQLHMIWPRRRVDSPPAPAVPEGYLLRCYTDADRAGYLELMRRAGFEGWDQKKVSELLQKVLPDGFFVVEYRQTGGIVATATALHSPRALHPCGGELGWVAADPAHRGKGLGLAVCAAATARLIRAGYKNIYLRTDDLRVPAIKTYLKLGYEPLLCAEGMVARWQRLYEQLGLAVPEGGFTQYAI